MSTNHKSIPLLILLFTQYFLRFTLPVHVHMLFKNLLIIKTVEETYDFTSSGWKTLIAGELYPINFFFFLFNLIWLIVYPIN